MPISGNRFSMTISQDRARAGGSHPPMIDSGRLAGDGATWPAGLILARNMAGSFVPYGELVQAIGAGDGAVQVFTAALGPVEPGSLVVTDGVETFSDDGFGSLTGSAGGSGKVNYATGKLSVDFNAAPANAVAVEASYIPEPQAVLDEETETVNGQAGAAPVITHGPVRKELLKVGLAAPEAPSAGLVRQLATHGIWAV